MAAAKMISRGGAFIDLAETVPNLWTVEFDGQRFGVRIQYDEGGRQPVVLVVDLYEIFVDEDGREIGTAEMWEVTVGNAVEVITREIAKAIDAEISAMEPSH